MKIIALAILVFALSFLIGNVALAQTATPTAMPTVAPTVVPTAVPTIIPAGAPATGLGGGK